METTSLAKKIAHDLTLSLKASVSLDCSKRESAHAAVLVRIKLLLSKYKCPPDKSWAAIDLVIKQAEVLADDSALYGELLVI